MKKAIITLVAILLFSTPLFASDTGILKDMAYLDKAYIPALVLTSQKDPVLASKAIKKLKTQWDFFKTRYQKNQLTDESWKTGFQKIDNLIKQAENIVRNKKPIEYAHYQLEEIRTILYDLRKKHNIDYLLDTLTDFHDEMRNIILTAMDKSPNMLDSSDITIINKALKKIRNIMIEFKNILTKKQEEIISIFGLSRKDMDKINKNISQEIQIMDKLEDALKENNKEKIIKYSLKLKLPYKKIYTTFGDFNIKNS